MESSSSAMRKPSAPSPSLPRARRSIPPLSRRCGILLILCYVVWAFVIPIKNVLMIDLPTLHNDVVKTETTAYAFNAAVANASLREIAGHEIVSVLQQIVAIVTGNRVVRDQLEAVGSFDIDTIHQLVDPDDFQILATYYSLVIQATEFPGSVFTPRPRHFVSTSSDLPNDAIGLWIQPTNGSNPWMLTLSCAAENARMDGTRCLQAGTDNVCIDFPVAGEKRTYTSASLNASRLDSGFGNPIGLLYLIEMFHHTMDTLFDTKSWNKTLEALQYVTSPTHLQTALDNGMSSAFVEGVPMLQEKFVHLWFSIPIGELRTTSLEACFLSEIVALSFYTKAFVMGLVEDVLTNAAVPTTYVASTDTRLTIPRDRIGATMARLLAQTVAITSGARVNRAVKTTQTKIFTGLSLTSITRATMRLKADLKLSNVDAFGANLRMLLTTAQYPEYYSFYQHSTETETRSARVYDVMTFSLLGGAMSGLNTYKSDWWGNTMGVWKLAELPMETNVARRDMWWDDEAKFASWFQRLEQTSDAPFYTLAKYIDIESTGIALDDNSVTRCHRGFYKTLVKIMWLSLLSASGLPSYLVFMSNMDGGARAWFLNTLKRNQLVGETINGARYVFPYTGTTNSRKDDGSAWIVVPLLHAMVEHFGRQQTTDLILAEFNASFPLFASTEYGRIHFLDSAQCRVGFNTNNISAETNTMEKITTAFYPSIQKFLASTLDDHAELHAKMAAGLVLEGIEMVQIPKNMLLGIPGTPAKNEVIGSPVFWRPTAFTAGILKLWPATAPPKSVIEAYRNSSVCYRTLELRYLNESVRCWVEPSSVTRSRAAFESEGLRYLIWSNWSISWVLNSISVCIAIQFLRRFVAAYRLTRFRCVSFWVASQLNFQSVGVLSYAQVLLMTISSVPLMVAYHMPTDPTFMDSSETRLYPKFIRDVIVTISATWFIRLGYDSVSQICHLNELYPWFNNVRLRIAALAIVFTARLATPDVLDDANYEMFKLLATCGGSAVLGALCAIVPLYLHHNTQKVAPTNSMTKLIHVASLLAPSLQQKAQNVVIKQLQREGMALNRHGLLGFSRFYGWSLTGLLVEGWEVVERKHKDEVVLTKGRCKIRLQVDDEGNITQCLL